jgi:hypothetical protein
VQFSQKKFVSKKVRKLYVKVKCSKFKKSENSLIQDLWLKMLELKNKRQIQYRMKVCSVYLLR